jgi:hypothetical protein
VSEFGEVQWPRFKLKHQDHISLIADYINDLLQAEERKLMELICPSLRSDVSGRRGAVVNRTMCTWRY